MGRCRTLFAVVLLMGMSLDGLGQERSVGIGVMIGTPTGLAVHVPMRSREGLHAYLGSFDGIAVGVDYAFHSDQFRNPALPFYYAPGLFMGAARIGGPRTWREETGLGLRLMFGIEYLIPNSRFDIAAEIGPALLLTPRSGIGLEVAMIGRFYP